MWLIMVTLFTFYLMFRIPDCISWYFVNYFVRSPLIFFYWYIILAYLLSMSKINQYTEENIRSLDWKEHIRMRPGMYIGKLGDGSSPDDGIYILLKEVLDNSIDEYVMGAGKTIEVSVQGTKVTVRDYGRGIPLGKVIDVVSKMNTGGKYDTRAFKKAVGLNGVGTKAVNALSDYFKVESNRDGKSVFAEFKRGVLDIENKPEDSARRRGTKVTFIPDESIFKNFKFRNEYIARMLKNYVYLGLEIFIFIIHPFEYGSAFTSSVKKSTSVLRCFFKI